MYFGLDGIGWDWMGWFAVRSGCSLPIAMATLDLIFAMVVMVLKYLLVMSSVAVGRRECYGVRSESHTAVMLTLT